MTSFRSGRRHSLHTIRMCDTITNSSCQGSPVLLDSTMISRDDNLSDPTLGSDLTCNAFIQSTRSTYPFNHTQKWTKQKMTSSMAADWKHGSKNSNIDSKNSIYVVFPEKKGVLEIVTFLNLCDKHSRWEGTVIDMMEPMMTSRGTDRDMLRNEP